MTESNRISEPKKTISDYVEACRSGDVDKLRSLFSSSALMSGFIEGEFYIGSPEIFFDEVRDNPSPASTGSTYTGDITSFEKVGKIANVTLKENGYLGLKLTNFFQLACVNGIWLIVSKAYVDK